MADQCQGIGVTRRDALRHFDPRSAVATRLGQNGCGRAAGVVLEGCCGPVIGQGVRAAYLVPETERTCPARSCECLIDATITVGGGGSANLSRVSARMRRTADRGCPGCGPTGEIPRFKATVGNTTAAA